MWNQLQKQENKLKLGMHPERIKVVMLNKERTLYKVKLLPNTLIQNNEIGEAGFFVCCTDTAF